VESPSLGHCLLGDLAVGGEPVRAGHLIDWAPGGGVLVAPAWVALGP